MVLNPYLAPPNIAPVAEALIGLYIIICSGAILGGAKPLPSLQAAFGSAQYCSSGGSSNRSIYNYIFGSNIGRSQGSLGLILAPKTY